MRGFHDDLFGRFSTNCFSRGAELFDATLSNEAMHQRGKGGLINHLYLLHVHGDEIVLRFPSFFFFGKLLFCTYKGTSSFMTSALDALVFVQVCVCVCVCVCGPSQKNLFLHETDFVPIVLFPNSLQGVPGASMSLAPTKTGYEERTLSSRTCRLFEMCFETVDQAVFLRSFPAFQQSFRIFPANL